MRAELTGERGAVCAESLSPLINLNFATPPPRILRSSFSLSFSAKAVYQLVQTFDTRPLRNFSAFVILVAALFSLIIS